HFSSSLTAMRLRQFAKVIAHRSQPYRLRKLVAVLNKGEAEKAPEFAARAVAHPERQHDMRESQQIASEPAAARLRRACDDPFQAIERALVVFARAVDGAEDRLVAFDETRGIHFGNEVQRPVGVVPCALGQQSPLALEPPPKLCVRKRR